MLESIQYIRKAILQRLTGQVLVDGVAAPVYGRVPNDATFPHIRVYSVSNNEIDQNQQSYNMEVLTRVECVTRFASDDGGETDVNFMASKCLQLLRTRSAEYFDLSAVGFNVYTSVNEGVTYMQDDLSDRTYFRAIIELSNRVEQVQSLGGLQSELQNNLQS